MKFIQSILILLSILVTFSLLFANPFSCKIPAKKPHNKKNPHVALIFKGYISIDQKHYGLIQLKNEDFEVTEGDVIEGYEIKKITKVRLEYSYKNRLFNSVLASTD